MAAATQPAPIRLTSKERAQICAEHLVLLAIGKVCYKRSDFLLDILVSQGKRDEPIKISKRSLGRKAIAAQLREAQKRVFLTITGQRYVVADKFADRNSINVGQNARRFEIAPLES